MERVWGIRTGRAAEILNKLKQYIQEHPDNYYGDVDTLLELICRQPYSVVMRF